MFLPVILDVLTLVSALTGQEVCRTQRSLDCFECDSDHLADCADPFNSTAAAILRSVPVAPCVKGCCIKMTQRVNTTSPSSRVVRTCSSRPDFRIETQLLSHVCITEWQDLGELCFCEEDRCNAAVRVNSRPTRVERILHIVIWMMAVFLWRSST